jgi:hypothetical protein
MWDLALTANVSQGCRKHIEQLFQASIHPDTRLFRNLFQGRLEWH